MFAPLANKYASRVVNPTSIIRNVVNKRMFSSSVAKNQQQGSPINPGNLQNSTTTAKPVTPATGSYPAAKAEQKDQTNKIMMYGVPAAIGGALLYYYLRPKNNTAQAASQSSEETPGDTRTVKTAVGEMGAALFQSKSPLNSFHSHTCEVHFYNGDMKRQMDSHEYISHINEDVMQAILFDSDRADARVVGVEYIITEKVFQDLPPEEKKMWHSHAYEVKSGLLTAPRMPEFWEHRLMRDLAPTYGKTINTWHVDSDPLPYGVPQIMMAPTKDGQVSRELMDKRRAYGIDPEKEKDRRKDIMVPHIANEADAWEKGNVVQCKLVPLGGKQA
jgi:hypothetical protein